MYRPLSVALILSFSIGVVGSAAFANPPNGNFPQGGPGGPGPGFGGPGQGGPGGGMFKRGMGRIPRGEDVMSISSLSPQQRSQISGIYQQSKTQMQPLLGQLR